jgi:hypothetical protein
MPDETNMLLRQILEAQQDLLAAYREESARVADFRKTAVEMQRLANRRGLMAALMVVIGGGIILAGMIASR